MVGAVAVRVARMAAGIDGNGGDMGVAFPIPYVVDQGPGPVEGGGSQIVLVPIDHVAGGIADAAADTLDPGICFATVLAVRRDLRERQ